MRPSTAVKLLRGPVPALVVLLAVADRRDQVEVFLLVGVPTSAWDRGRSRRHALGAVDVSPSPLPGVRDLAALAVHLRAVLVGELDEVVVVDLAHAASWIAAVTLDAEPMPLASTGWSPLTQLQTSRLWTCCSQMWSPREPDEVVPVAHLVFHFGLAGLAIAEPDGAAVPVDPQRISSPSDAVLDLLDPAEELACCGGVAGRRPPSVPSRRPALLVSISERKPGASTQQGFSMKTCLPASTAAHSEWGGSRAAWPGAQCPARQPIAF